jgi:hypothetical protein
MKRDCIGSRTFLIFTAFLFFISASSLPAGSIETVNREIDHLLQYIENSDCIFIRNGRESNAAKAQAHIQNKYVYVKGRVKTAEDFIKYAATKSSMSGKPYKLRCSKKEIYVADWLYSELRKLRKRMTNDERRTIE